MFRLTRLLRPFRVMFYVRLLALAWRHRHDLRRAVPLAGSAPGRLLAGRATDVMTEARILRALAADRRTRRRAGIALCAVTDGVAVLRLADRGDERTVNSVVRGVVGVRAAEFATEAPIYG